jgi:hypothetical protein
MASDSSTTETNTLLLWFLVWDRITLKKLFLLSETTPEAGVSIIWAHKLFDKAPTKGEVFEPWYKDDVLDFHTIVERDPASRKLKDLPAGFEFAYSYRARELALRRTNRPFTLRLAERVKEELTLCSKSFHVITSQQPTTSLCTWPTSRIGSSRPAA